MQGCRALVGLVCLLWTLFGSAAQARTPRSAPAVDAAEYRLGAGDAVRISVYQSPDLTLETRIGEAGVVSYPLLGSMKIGGMTDRCRSA